MKKCLCVDCYQKGIVSQIPKTISDVCIDICEMQQRLIQFFYLYIFSGCGYRWMLVCEDKLIS